MNQKGLIRYEVPGIETYPGGKGASGAVQQIINVIPQHNILIEGCLGSGNLIRYIEPRQARHIGIEIDSTVSARWAKVFRPELTTINADFFRWAAENISLLSRGDVVLYLDPPFPMETRKSQLPLYSNEFTDEQHLRLLTAIKGFRCNVLISTFPNEMYARELSAWSKITYESRMRRGIATNVLYFNFPAPEVLHDTRFVGKDYREREKIRKRVRRKVSEFAAMGSHERQAILRELNEKWG